MAYRNALGAAYLVTEPNRALAEFEEATRLDPRTASSHFNTGLAHDRLGDLDAAVDAYLRAVARDPEMALAHLNIGLLDRDEKRARRHLRRFLELSDDPALRAHAEQRITDLDAR